MLSTTFLRTAASAAARRVPSSSSQTTCRLASTLILSDPLTVDGSVPPATQSAVTAAIQLDSSSSTSNTIELLVVGAMTPTQVPRGVTKLHVATATQPTAETIASTVTQVVTDNNHKYDYVVGTSSKFGATVIPRIAAMLGVSPVTDIIQVLDSGELS
jgi:electron transfer flavoprotein alpha subunit